MDRATIRQKKTGRPVRFELTDQTRQAIDEYLRLTGRKAGQFLFAGRGDRGGLTTRQYARLVLEWIASIGLDPAMFCAKAAFKADGSFDLGDLLPSVIGQMNALLGKAADAANSWKNEAHKEEAAKRKAALKEANTQKGEEDWAVNKAVHFNEWANFGKNDFVPVVMAFKTLLAQFWRDKCGSPITILPKVPKPESLRCACMAINLNLKAKPK